MLRLLQYCIDSRRVWWFNATAKSRARFKRTVLGSFWLGGANVLSTFALAIVYSNVLDVDDFFIFLVY